MDGKEDNEEDILAGARQEETRGLSAGLTDISITETMETTRTTAQERSTGLEIRDSPIFLPPAELVNSSVTPGVSLPSAATTSVALGVSLPFVSLAVLEWNMHD